MAKTAAQLLTEAKDLGHAEARTKADIARAEKLVATGQLAAGGTMSVGGRWYKPVEAAPAGAPTKIDVVVTLVDGEQKHGGLSPRAAFDLGAEVEADGCTVEFFETGTGRRVGPLRLARLAHARA